MQQWIYSGSNLFCCDFFSPGCPKQPGGRHEEGKRLDWSTVGVLPGRGNQHKAMRVKGLKAQGLMEMNVILGGAWSNGTEWGSQKMWVLWNEKTDVKGVGE